jgi:hypothetical protein
MPLWEMTQEAMSKEREDVSWLLSFFSSPSSSSASHWPNSDRSQLRSAACRNQPWASLTPVIQTGQRRVRDRYEGKQDNPRHTNINICSFYKKKKIK